MCVIVHKPSGEPMLNEDDIRKMFVSNSDGVGIAVKTKNKRWDVSKGHMVLAGFLIQLNKMASKYNLTNTDVILHFRLGTSGLNKPGNCHPFPITNNIKRLRECTYSASWIAAHNGVIGSGEQIIGFGEITDTQVYVRDILHSGIIQVGLNKDMENTKRILKATLGTDKLIIGGPKEVIRIGDWKVKEGIFYSNLYWNWFGDYFGWGTRKYNTYVNNYSRGHFGNNTQIRKPKYGPIKEECPFCYQHTYDNERNFCSQCGSSKEDLIICPFCYEKTYDKLGNWCIRCFKTATYLQKEETNTKQLENKLTVCPFCGKATYNETNNSCESCGASVTDAHWG